MVGGAAGRGGGAGAGRATGRAAVGRRGAGVGCDLAALGRYLLASWPPVLLRSLLLWGLWEWSGRWGPRWAAAAAVGVCGYGRVWALAGRVGAPGRSGGVCRLGLWQAQRLLLVGYLLLGWQWSSLLGARTAWGLGVGCVVCEREEPWVQVERQADGSYQATLCGHFTLAVAG